MERYLVKSNKKRKVSLAEEEVESRLESRPQTSTPLCDSETKQSSGKERKIPSDISQVCGDNPSRLLLKEYPKRKEVCWVFCSGLVRQE